ncbi:hypothetical protein [Glaciihabitans sp. UYNi722]|uniref:hypothetical protein n=1 Tax=Glaciihabitans sp. UYNi722 TaxID=3156344 RepID=UPI00339A00FF
MELASQRDQRVMGSPLNEPAVLVHVDDVSELDGGETADDERLTSVREGVVEDKDSAGASMADVGSSRMMIGASR